MKALYILAFSLLCSLSAQEGAPATTPEDTGTVSSTHAEYDGNVLILKGHVLLDHGLGKMRAEQASLQKQETGKEFPFSFIHLENEVMLDLKDNAKLACARADLDFIELKGQLFSEEEGHVTYSDILENQVPVELLGKTVEIGMSRLPAQDKKNAYQIDTVTATTDVHIHYAKDFLLKAHLAHFAKAQENSTKAFAGRIKAHPKDDASYCTLTHLQDRIDATSVEVDLSNDQLALTRPHGTLASSLVPHADNLAVHFNAGSLHWDHPKETLHLKEDVHIEDASYGVIDAEKSLQLTQGKEGEKTVIKAIQTQGKTRLEHQTSENSLPHVLICHGTISLDRDKLNAHLSSPPSATEETQIYYQEARIASFANDALIDYAIVNSTLQPVALKLTGNIRLFSHDENSPKRCSLADRLTYSPATRTLILYANPGNRVLFWDEEQSLRIGAQEIHITYDPDTKKELINGIGNVKFAFTSEESAMLNQVFPFFKKHL